MGTAHSIPTVERQNYRHFKNQEGCILSEVRSNEHPSCSSIQERVNNCNVPIYKTVRRVNACTYNKLQAIPSKQNIDFSIGIIAAFCPFILSHPQN